MERFTEILWKSFVSILGLCAIYVVMNFLISEKPIKQYYLSSDDGALQIKTDIENYVDGRISLNGLTYLEAAKLVDSLNSSLHKFPRLK